MIKVVIVEDDPNIAELHHHFIEQVEQYQVVGIAGSIHIAQQLVTHTKPDLVIVDNYLPDGQGVELVYQWLESDQKPECILVTAANDASTVQKAHRFGAFDFLVKPVDYSRLTESLLRFAKVKNHMRSQESFRQSQLDDLFHLGKRHANRFGWLRSFYVPSGGGPVYACACRAHRIECVGKLNHQ